MTTYAFRDYSIRRRAQLLRIRLFGERTPFFLKRSRHDPARPLDQDERDRYEVEYKILRADRDEWRRRYEDLRARYDNDRGGER